jgi:hypothetical protein
VTRKRSEVSIKWIVYGGAWMKREHDDEQEEEEEEEEKKKKKKKDVYDNDQEASGNVVNINPLETVKQAAPGPETLRFRLLKKTGWTGYADTTAPLGKLVLPTPRKNPRIGLGGASERGKAPKKDTPKLTQAERMSIKQRIAQDKARVAKVQEEILGHDW